MEKRSVQLSRKCSLSLTQSCAKARRRAWRRWQFTCSTNSMRVLLATDGSQQAALAMRAASRLLARTDREMHVLHVAAEPRLPKSGALGKQAYHRLAARTRYILQHAKEVLAEEGVDAFTSCQTGSPARLIM